jgi:hypothetical protein
VNAGETDITRTGLSISTDFPNGREGVLQDAGNAMIVFWRRDYDAMTVGDRFFEATHLGWRVDAIFVLVVEGELRIANLKTDFFGQVVAQSQQGCSGKGSFSQAAWQSDESYRCDDILHDMFAASCEWQSKST